MISKLRSNWITKFVGQPKVIMDAGAATGEDSARFKRDFLTARVISFEPSKVFHPMLKKLVRQTGIEFYPIALGDKNETVKFYQSYNPTQKKQKKFKAASSVYPPTKDCKIRKPHLDFFQVEYSVSMVTLQEFCKEKGIEDISVLHLDAHGAELPIVKNMGEIKPKIIFCETNCFSIFNCGYGKTELDSFLISIGYEIKMELKTDTLYLRVD